MQAVHSIVVFVGDNKSKILCVDYTHPFAPDTVLLDPSTEPNTVKLVLNGLVGDLHDLFCSGHASDARGKILFAGGDHACPGAEFTSTYTPPTDDVGVGSFQLGPNEAWYVHPVMGPVDTKRWYVTCTTLPDGRILVTDGSCVGPGGSSVDGNPNVPVIFNTNAPVGVSPWQPLTGAEYYTQGEPIPWTCDPPPEPQSFDILFYPFMFVLVDASVLWAGGHYQNGSDNFQKVSRKLVTTGGGSWSCFPSDGVPTPIKGHTAVMYQAGKILKAGGGTQGFSHANCEPTPLTNRVFMIDTTAGTPQWVELPAMPHPRIHFYAVALPDGKVLMSGGNSGGPGTQVCTLANAVLEPDLYDPYAAGTLEDPYWRTLASMCAARQYHSSTVLLDDGRIFTAGGEDGETTHKRSYQIFKPPYFFQGPRPEIDPCTSPATVFYGGSFLVTLSSDDAPQITKVRLIRPGSATHSFDQTQRSMELNFCAVAGSASQLVVDAPANGYEAPPGYYRLFAAKGTNGALPSTAHWVRLIQGTPSQALILAANPPGGITSPWVFGFTDPLQTGATTSLTQGIGGAGTPAEGPVTYHPISVTFTEAVTLSAADIDVACTYVGTSQPCATGCASCPTPCPKVSSVSGSGTSWQVSLDRPIPPGGCTRISFSANAVLQYNSLPGDVSFDGLSNTQDADALRLALFNGQAAADLPRYDINRDGLAKSDDYLRLIQLLAGTNTTQAWNGVALAPCGDCGESLGGGGGGFSSPMTGGGEAMPESAPGGEAECVDLTGYTWAACAEWGWTAEQCQPLVDFVSGP